MRSSIQSGFTLTEMLIAIVLIGILSAVAIPRLFDFTDNYGTLEQMLNIEKSINESMFVAKESLKFRGIDTYSGSFSIGGTEFVSSLGVWKLKASDSSFFGVFLKFDQSSYVEFKSSSKYYLYPAKVSSTWDYRRTPCTIVYDTRRGYIQFKYPDKC